MHLRSLILLGWYFSVRDKVVIEEPQEAAETATSQAQMKQAAPSSLDSRTDSVLSAHVCLVSLHSPLVVELEKSNRIVSLK